MVELLLRRKGLTIEETNEAWSRSSLANYEGEMFDRKVWYKCFDEIGRIYGILIEAENKNSHEATWYILNPINSISNSCVFSYLGVMSYLCRKILQ